MPSTGLPIGTPDGPSATEDGSTVQAEALMVHSVGPYRLTSSHFGRVSTKRWASRRGSASPPQNTWLSAFASGSRSVSSRAWSSVGTHCRAVTSWRARVSTRVSGSR